MTVAKIAPLNQPSLNSLTRNARGVLATLSAYGGQRGLILGAGRLLSATGLANDTSAAVTMQQRFGQRPGLIEWSYMDRETYPGNESWVDIDKASTLAEVKQHWRDGGICGFNVAWRNFRTATGATPPYGGWSGDHFDRRRDRPEDVSDLLLSAPDTTAKRAYWRFVDRMGDYLNTQVVDDSGEPIPQIFRVFSESNGWYNFIQGEGWNPTNQQDRYITNITRQSGGKYRITFAQRQAGTQHPTMPLGGPVIQVTGSSVSSWNGRYDSATLVSGSDAVGDVLVIDCWKGEAQPNGSAPVDATLRAYPVNGFWWAGLDRAAFVVQLWKDTVDFLRNTKGCKQLLFTSSNMPADDFSNPWSTDELKVDAQGRNLLYSNWDVGNDYVHVIGTDTYLGVSAANTVDRQKLIDSCAKFATMNPARPWLFHEFGYGTDNSMTGPGHLVAGHWTKELATIQSKFPYCCGIGFWNKYMFPQPGQPAFASFNEAVNNGVFITLDKLKRAV